MLYLGEINDSQQASWRKNLEVFDEQQQRATTLSLFPEDRPVPVDALDTIQVKLSEMQLRRARPYGNCRLGCELWRQLKLDEFWERKLPRGREEVGWPLVLELLVVNRLIDPGSEFPVHRQWFDQSAMDLLLGVDFVEAEKGSAVPLFGSNSRAPAGVVPASAAALEDAVRCAVRCTAVRSDQHVRREKPSSIPKPSVGTAATGGPTASKWWSHW